MGNAGAKNFGLPKLERFAFEFLNGVGDLFDIIPAVDPGARTAWFNLSRAEAIRQSRLREHCSALVKVSANFSRLIVGHSSWFTYSAMNRISKTYRFHFENNRTAAHSITFSSYPGFLESLDDFYEMSSGLAMVQTTNGHFNKTLLNLIQPNTLLAWQ